MRRSAVLSLLLPIVFFDKNIEGQAKCWCLNLFQNDISSYDRAERLGCERYKKMLGRVFSFKLARLVTNNKNS
jgi:hypothetical protein